MDSAVIIGVLAVFVAGINRGFTGFGSGLVMVPILSMIYNPLFAVMVVTLLELIPSLQLLPRSFRDCHWRSVLPMAATALVTVPAGVMLLSMLGESTMKLFIATLLFVSVIVLYFNVNFHMRDRTNRLGIPTGGVSGLLSGATGLGGVPVIMYYLARRIPVHNTRSSTIVFLAITSLISVISFAVKGMLTTEVVNFSLYVIPVFIFAIWLGSLFFSKASEKSYRKITLAVLGCIAIFMMLQTLSS